MWRYVVSFTPSDFSNGPGLIELNLGTTRISSLTAKSPSVCGSTKTKINQSLGSKSISLNFSRRPKATQLSTMPPSESIPDPHILGNLMKIYPLQTINLLTITPLVIATIKRLSASTTMKTPTLSPSGLNRPQRSLRADQNSLPE